MKRSRIYIFTFVAAAAAGWAAAHFSVGNAGSVALRAVVSEGRMAFSSSEKSAAAARIASLEGKPMAEQAAILAGWWNLTSVAEIRHLYAAIDKVPYELRGEARDILLGRWAVLDPDSLLLGAIRETDFNKRGPFLRAFGRYWAAGRSPEEVVDLLVNTAGDLRKFMPDLPVGGYYRPGSERLYGNSIVDAMDVDPRMLLDLAQRLTIKLPPEGLAAVFSALAKVDPAEARRRLAGITDPVARRAATAGLASQLASSDPDAALALCAGGDRELATAVTPGYLKHLLTLPPGEAWQKAAAFSDQFQMSGNSMIPFLQRMAARDPAGFFQWMGERPARDRQMGEIILALGPGPDAMAQAREYFVSAPPQSGTWMLSSLMMTGGNAGESISWLQSSGRPDLQIQTAGRLLYDFQRSDRIDLSTTETAQIIEMMHAAPLSEELTERFLPAEIRDERMQGIAKAVMNNWPESANLLETLSPAARETALPGFIQGVAAIEPARAAALLAAVPETLGAAEAAADLAKVWAGYDLDAAQQWSASLTGERRARAEAALRESAAPWQISPVAAAQ